MERTSEEHESFGLISAHRISTRDEVLFGSSIRHNNTIVIEVKRAIRERDLNRDWFYGRESLVRLEMSPSQFADFITNMNQGSGIPCTLRRVSGKGIEPCPETNERLVFENEFREKMQDLSSQMCRLLDESREILNSSKPPKKADKQSLVSKMNKLQQDLESNIPFIQSQFNEAMDKVVTEAKGEIEAHLAQKFYNMGLDQAKAENLLTAYDQPALPPVDEQCQSETES